MWWISREYSRLPIVEAIDILFTFAPTAIGEFKHDGPVGITTFRKRIFTADNSFYFANKA